MSASTSANTSKEVSPASSTSSMADVLTAALAIDIENKGAETVNIHTTALSHIHGQDRMLSHVLAPEIIGILKEPSYTTIAFAFDIDGVLVRSKDALPGAAKTIKMLQRRNIPFILLTNGGGSTEKDHVAILGRRLGLAGLHEKQFVQSHSPYHSLVPSLANKNILVLGGTGNKIREVAHAYGFKNVCIPSDFVKDNHHIHPFLELTKDYHHEHGNELPRMEDGRVQIHAILVWSSPRDEGLDKNLILDLLMSEQGIIGTVSPKNKNPSLPNNGFLQDGQPPVYFCNPDLTWATSYSIPRAAQGLFKAGLEGSWSALTNGADMSGHVHVFGKPTEATYIYGEKTLQDWHASINGPNAKLISTVYMIGDNPASDIQGSKNYRSRYGSEWKSVLVESGIHVAGTEPAHHPTHFAAGVKEAVELAMLEEGYELGDGDDGWEKENEAFVVPDSSEDFGQG
ncbi:related to HAD superfamily hydrolase [Phialocephala subalpina]|uniref:Related to HAD superfamily hydrolase n=1 Tax=Phialocephala subalpina TaxID=576137 RepID=A0A1L7XXB7_9HELO|nr:related to HAD superfamily hydrolase [Phialocephala subalpina]